jgi:hypothetical protein
MLGVEYDRRVFIATSDMDAGESFISVSGREVNFQIVATKFKSQLAPMALETKREPESQG